MDEVVRQIINIIDEGISHPSTRSRNSDGAAGETLEMLLGLDINNSKKADTLSGEIKTFKENKSGGKCTLFNCEPEYRSSVRKDLFQTYAYPRSDGERFEVTVYTQKYNSQGLKLEVDKRQKRLYLVDKKTGRLKHNYWTFEALDKRLQDKHGSGLIHVGRETKNNQHKYTSLTLYNGISLEKFLSLIEKDEIIVDFRMRYAASKLPSFKNRGTAFRMSEKTLGKLFTEVTEIR